VNVEFQIDPADDASPGDTSSSGADMSPSEAITVLESAESDGILDQALADEDMPLVPNSFAPSDTATQSYAVDSGSGLRTKMIANVGRTAADKNECSYAERATDAGPEGDPVFFYPRGVALERDWMYVLDANIITRMRSEAAKALATSLGKGSTGESFGLYTIVGSRESGDLDGVYTTCRFFHPNAIVGAANPDTPQPFLFVADTGNHRIRVIDSLQRSSKTLISRKSFTANGQVSALKFPRGLAVVQPHLVVGTTDGNTWQLIVADQNRIIRLTFNWNDLATTSEDTPAAVADVLAGGFERGITDGPGAVARFNRPHGLQLLARAKHADLFVADFGNHRIRRLNLGSNLVTTIVSAGLTYPRGLSHDPAKYVLYLSDQNRIYSVDCGLPNDACASDAKWFAGVKERGYLNRPGELAQFSQPFNLVFQPAIEGECADPDIGTAGRLLVSDFGNHRVRSIDMATKAVVTFKVHEKSW
jgi:DNA-binding beta-propeller fold protein YncE